MKLKKKTNQKKQFCSFLSIEVIARMAQPGMPDGPSEEPIENVALGEAYSKVIHGPICLFEVDRHDMFYRWVEAVEASSWSHGFDPAQLFNHALGLAVKRKQKTFFTL